MKLKATKIISLNKNIINNDISKKNPVIFCGISILGIITGVVLQSINTVIISGSTQKFNDFIQINAQKNFRELFVGNLSYNMVYIIVPMFLGLSAAGFFLVYAVPFFKGLGIGAVCALIYSSYAIKGILYCLIIVFPVALIQFAAIILSCSESYQMSVDLFSLIRKEETAEEIKIHFFFLRYLIILLIITTASLLYGICNQVFFRFLI